MIRGLLLLSLLLGLVACGFKLRGSEALPAQWQQLQLDAATPNGELARTLQRTLSSSGVQLLEQGAPRLIVSAVTPQRRLLSVDSAGNPQEYELTSSVTISASEMPNGNQMPAKTLSVSRDYIYESTGVLSSSDQEAQLRVEMERELARRIMRSLRAAK